MKIRLLFAVFALLIAAGSGPGTAATLVSGSAAVIGPGVLRVNGQDLRLFDIRVPGAAAKCAEWQGQKQVGYACDLRARAFLESLVADEAVACVSEDKGVATCYADGRDLAESLVAAGWAESCGRGNRYVAEEEAARKAGRGLWAGQFSLDRQCSERARESRRQEQ